MSSLISPSTVAMGNPQGSSANRHFIYMVTMLPLIILYIFHIPSGSQTWLAGHVPISTGFFFFFKWGHLNWFRYIPISPWHPIRPHFFLVKTKQNYRIPTAISNHVNPMIFWYSHDIPVLIINGNFKILKWRYCTLLYHICGLYKGYVTH